MLIFIVLVTTLGNNETTLAGHLRKGLLLGSLFTLLLSVELPALVLAKQLIVEMSRGLMNAFEAGRIDPRELNHPNEGIRRSLKSSILSGLLCWVAETMLFTLVLVPIILLIAWRASWGDTRNVIHNLLAIPILPALAALFFSLRVAWKMGGRACVEHAVLRLILWRAGFTPRRYIHFLDFVSEVGLLIKAGGGYQFMHPLIQDYLAGLIRIRDARSFDVKSDPAITFEPGRALPSR